MKSVTEGSDLDVEATPTSGGIPTLAGAIDYRIDCITTGTQLLDWSSVTPQETVEINVPGSLNRIVSDDNTRERKQMVVRATTDGKVVNKTIDWEVQNIYGVR